MQDGIFLYHPLEDFLSLDQVVGGIHELAIPYLKDDPIGYVDVVSFLFRGGVSFDDVRHHCFTKGHAFGSLFPLGISVRIGEKKHGSSCQYTEFFFSHLALAARSQPYIIGEDSRTDNGTLLGFHQDHHLVGMDFQQVFPEKALGELPILCQHTLPFQYAVYPVYCRCLPSLDTVSVLGIVLHHLSRAHLVRLVYLPKDNRAVTGSPQTVFLQQPLQHLFRPAAIIGSKERGEEAEEITAHALGFLHIVRENATDSYWLAMLLFFRLLHSLPVKRETIGCAVFGMVLEILFRSVVIPTTAFMVAPADRWMQRHIVIVHVIDERMPVPALGTSMPGSHPFVLL